MHRIAPNPDQLSAVLRARRLELGLTQAALAKRSGLLQKTVSALENHPRSRSIATLYRMLDALDLEIAVGTKPIDDDRGPDAW